MVGPAFCSSLPLRCGALRRTVRRAFPPRPHWDALRELQVPPRTTASGAATLDGTLDMVGYQLFRDGFLCVPPRFAEAADARRLERERQRAEARTRRNGVVLRRSVKETALVMGCDEAGRGPLAGPVVGAAVCRLPLSSFNNGLAALYGEREQLQIFDSKSVSEAQRRFVFHSITGYDTLFDVVADKSFTVHHAGDESAADGTLTRRSPISTKLQRLPFKKLLSMQTPHLISYHGANTTGNYLYLWAIAFANHTYIDTFNIYIASMRSMHYCSLELWRMLNDTRFSYEKAPRPRRCSIAQYLFSRFCIAAAHDDDLQYVLPTEIDLLEGAAEFFDTEPVQPPLILVDGHAAPAETIAFFDGVQNAGCVQPIIEGDKRSLAIAAASCLAKVARDEAMNHLNTLYPRYQFSENKGYPVEQHMRAVQRHGVSPIHRKSYRPCAIAITKQQKRKARESLAEKGSK